MQHLTDEDFEKVLGKKAVAIVGDAGKGKTFLAKTIAHTCSKKQPLVIKHHEAITAHDCSKHDVVVFDDANLRHLKTEQDIIN